ncbi:type II secretion system F family protein [bacterium 210820-DFI.6.37]|nr:type II secretion system F family protein [bacterium 210820-DFI.6.37]
MRIDYSQYELSAKEKCGFLAVGYVSVFTVLYLFYHSMIFSIAGGLLPFFFLGKYSSWKAEKRRALLTIQFKDLLYSLSASIAAGFQLSGALKEGMESLRLLYDDDSPLIIELRYMVRNISENRESDIRLLLDFAKRSCCEDIDNFVQVYIICTATGGDIEKVLKSTIEILVDKINIEREIRTLTAQKKFEGTIISVMPVFIILFLNFFSPDYLKPLYVTIAGRFIMTAALAGILGAFYLTKRLTSIEV